MAGRIPQSFINDLIDRIDIVELIGARLTLKKSGKNWTGLCPFHNEKTPSFSVSPDKQFYHCFGCGESGTALTFLMQFDRLEFVEAVEALAAIAGVEVPREHGRAPATPEGPDLYALMERAEGFYRRQLAASPVAIEYLKARGVNGLTARDFGIGYAPEGWSSVTEGLPGVSESDLLACGLLTQNDEGRRYARFRSRIMFPIRDVRGRVIAFGGRLIGTGQGPKYLNSPETALFNKSAELYGLFEARRALKRIERLVLVEGYMDVVALVQAGIANAVGALGTASGEGHFRKLYRYAPEVVCCFDGDQAGRQAAWRALENALPVLEEGRRLAFVFLPEGEDPDTLVRARGRDDFENRIANALPAIEYLFRELATGLDLATIDGRARLASLAGPHIARVPEGILRDLMNVRLRELSGYGPRGEPVSAAPTGRRPKSPVEPLDVRVLRMLLKRPALVRRLDEATRQGLLVAASGTLLGEVLNFVLTTEGVSSAAILGRWAGSPAQATLVGLCERPWILREDALEPEFVDAVSKLLSIGARHERRELLDDVHQDPSREKFARFWSLRRSAAAGPDDP